MNFDKQNKNINIANDSIAIFLKTYLIKELSFWKSLIENKATYLLIIRGIIIAIGPMYINKEFNALNSPYKSNLKWEPSKIWKI